MGSFIPDLEKDSEEVKRRGITITISGPAASGKSTTARMLAKKINLEYVSMGSIFRELADESGLSLEDYLARSTRDTHRKADLRQLFYAKRGGVVIEGRLGGWVAGNHAQFRFWLTAPIAVRAERYSKRHGVDLKTARELVEKRDLIDVNNYRKFYGIDFKRLDIYDFVINNEYFDAEITTDIITYLAKYLP